MNAIITAPEMTEAVDRLLTAMGMKRKAFGDQRDAAILGELSDYFNERGSVVASLVTGFAADTARELEGYVIKVCCRCKREFWIVGYLAPKPAFDRCGRADCVRMSALTA